MRPLLLTLSISISRHFRQWTIFRKNSRNRAELTLIIKREDIREKLNIFIIIIIIIIIVIITIIIIKRALWFWLEPDMSLNNLIVLPTKQQHDIKYKRALLVIRFTGHIAKNNSDMVVCTVGQVYRAKFKPNFIPRAEKRQYLWVRHEAAKTPINNAKFIQAESCFIFAAFVQHANCRWNQMAKC